jgi:hypothetical protein
MTTASVWLPVLVSVVALAFWVYCLVDFSRTEERAVRTFTRPVWIAVLVFGNAAGGVVWLVYGRPQRR